MPGTPPITPSSNGVESGGKSPLALRELPPKSPVVPPASGSSIQGVQMVNQEHPIEVQGPQSSKQARSADDASGSKCITANDASGNPKRVTPADRASGQDKCSTPVVEALIVDPVVAAAQRRAAWREEVRKFCGQFSSLKLAIAARSFEIRTDHRHAVLEELRYFKSDNFREIHDDLCRDIVRARPQALLHCFLCPCHKKRVAKLKADFSDMMELNGFFPMEDRIDVLKPNRKRYIVDDEEPFVPAKQPCYAPKSKKKRAAKSKAKKHVAKSKAKKQIVVQKPAAKPEPKRIKITIVNKTPLVVKVEPKSRPALPVIPVVAEGPLPSSVIVPAASSVVPASPSSSMVVAAQPEARPASPLVAAPKSKKKRANRKRAAKSKAKKQVVIKKPAAKPEPKRIKITIVNKTPLVVKVEPESRPASPVMPVVAESPPPSSVVVPAAPPVVSAPPSPIQPVIAIEGPPMSPVAVPAASPVVAAPPSPIMVVVAEPEARPLSPVVAAPASPVVAALPSTVATTPESSDDEEEADEAPEDIEGRDLPDLPPTVVTEKMVVLVGQKLRAADQVKVIRRETFKAILYGNGVVIAQGHLEGVKLNGDWATIYNDPHDPIVDMAGGKMHLILLSKAGHVFTLGRSAEGQLGANLRPKMYRQTNIKPFAMKRTIQRTVVVGGQLKKKEVLFAAVEANGNTSVAIARNGTVYRCGRGYGPLFNCY